MHQPIGYLELKVKTGRLREQEMKNYEYNKNYWSEYVK